MIGTFVFTVLHSRAKMKLVSNSFIPSPTTTKKKIAWNFFHSTLQCLGQSIYYVREIFGKTNIFNPLIRKRRCNRKKIV